MVFFFSQATIVQCTPPSRAWGPELITCKAVNVPALQLTISVFGLLTDVFILLLPVPVVLRLHTDLKRRCKALLSVVHDHSHSLIRLFGRSFATTSFTASHVHDSPPPPIPFLPSNFSSLDESPTSLHWHLALTSIVVASILRQTQS
jgi:hypothetical protein